MNTALAQAVVQSLSFSADTRENAARSLSRFSERDWERVLGWMDNSGLALYFLHRIEETENSSVLPERVWARLQRNKTDNQERVMRMVEEFGRINRQFDQAGFNYAVVKGFSLVPAFCPDINLRAQSDLDYMVDEASLAAAQRILLELGYVMVQATGAQFVFRSAERLALLSDSPYAFTTKPMVELHLSMWETPNTQIAFTEPGWSLDIKRTSEYGGMKFPVLSAEDSFLLQIIHVFQHILCCWIRVSWLLELGYFLTRQAADIALWEKIDQRFQPIGNLTEFAAVVIGLVTRTFAAPFPAGISHWNSQLRSTSRLWVDNYGPKWILSDHPYHESGLFPPTKLVLFLHEEYIGDPRIRKRVKSERIFPWKRPPRIAELSNAVSPAQAAHVEWGFRMQRIYHHLGAGLRYAWEVPRWRKLKKQTSLFDSQVGKPATEPLPKRFPYSSV